MKITLAQLNPVVGDVAGNLQKILDLWPRFSSQSDLLVFPELFLVGYPPRDLLEKPSLIAAVRSAIQELLKASTGYPGSAILVGTPWPSDRDSGKPLCNSALVIYQGKTICHQHKSLLPTYDVFDETRYFEAAGEVQVCPFKDQRLGISICEDAWYGPESWSRQLYPVDPLKVLAQKGATLLINIAASPFQVDKEATRYQLLRRHAEQYQLPLIYVNQVGGNDELIFDGRSLVLDRAGELLSVLPAFQEEVVTIDIEAGASPRPFVPQEPIASVYQALILGTRDYLRKCDFSRAVVGLSGGIDSAVTCCLAAQALGRENVLGVAMPSPYSSPASLADARKLAENLGIEFKVIPIATIYRSYLDTLSLHLPVEEINVTLENIQARIRGNILMALSNQYGYLVLSTGNKSELAVGYCTLYGDMSGGLAVLADVPKTMVYQLGHYINRAAEIIPAPILTKAPSAELKPDQKDQDTLPPYDLLDQILHYYLTEKYSAQDIINLNYDPEVVHWVIRTVDRNEYKRRQAAPGLKVTSKAFGMGRRMPIAANYNPKNRGA
ncbi:MAG: NAD+ synthase [Deltaproteobacteria bacterium]|nr:NAD+ synthase [Deltaproteobacteria bacterium]